MQPPWRVIEALGAASKALVSAVIGRGGARQGLSRLWSPGDKSRRALAALGDDEVSSLSDSGRQLRREARAERILP